MHVCAHQGLGRQRTAPEGRWGPSRGARDYVIIGTRLGPLKGKKGGQRGSQSQKVRGEATTGLPTSERSALKPPPVMADLPRHCSPSLLLVRLMPARSPHCRCASPILFQHMWFPKAAHVLTDSPAHPYFFTVSSRVWGSEEDIRTPSWRGGRALDPSLGWLQATPNAANGHLP